MNDLPPERSQNAGILGELHFGLGCSFWPGRGSSFWQNFFDGFDDTLLLRDLLLYGSTRLREYTDQK